MKDDTVALLLTLACENAELRDQLDATQKMLVGTTNEAGKLHVLIETVQAERDAWQVEAEVLRGSITPP